MRRALHLILQIPCMSSEKTACTSNHLMQTTSAAAQLKQALFPDHLASSCSPWHRQVLGHSGRTSSLLDDFSRCQASNVSHQYGS